MAHRSRLVSVLRVPVAAVAVAVAACSSSASGDPASTPSTKTGGPARGALGGPCQTDDDCADDAHRCLAPLANSSATKACVNPCGALDDCAPLFRTTYDITVPETEGRQGTDPQPNMWRSKTLARGIGCKPAGDKAGEPKFCQFVCPDLAAASTDGKGNIEGCACLPGYKPASDKRTCVVDTDVQCSIFSYATESQRTSLRERFGIESASVRCDACNSTMSFTDGFDCHSNRFLCDLDASLEGRCSEVISASELEGCILQSTNVSCDCRCPSVDACGPTSNGTDCACCTCTNNGKKTPRPVCSGDGSTPTPAPPSTGGGGTSPENTAAACTDGKDNDGDGYLDCDDKECCSVVNCSTKPGTFCGPHENTAAACTDGKDNDGDGYLDCNDRDCCAVVNCKAQPTTYCGKL